MNVWTPNTLEQVSEVLSQMNEKGKFIGGGTDLIISMRLDRARPEELCYLGYLPEFKEINSYGTGLSIGAYATMTQMEQHPLIKEHFPALADAAGDVGSLQIRNHATIGGNIGNASPAGDLYPVLYLYKAEVEVMGPKGTRKVAIEEILERPGKLTIAPNEAIYRIHLPFPDFHSAFVKLGSRKKVTISRIGVALSLKTENEVITDAQILVGAISIKPVHVEEGEALLKGNKLSEELILKVAGRLSHLIYRITPKEFDRDYKIFASKGVISDVFERISSRMNG